MPAATITGLDIGSTSIRAVETTRQGKESAYVSNYGQVGLPAGAVTGGVVVDDKAITAALRQLWLAQKFESKDVVLGVSNNQILVREMEIANLPPAELKKALPFLVREVLPIPVEQALLDFYPLGPGEAPDTVRGLLMAAPKEAVLTAIRAVEKAGLFVAKVDLGVLAALRSAAFLAGDVEAVVDIGAQTTNIVVHRDGIPEIVRTVPRGGVEITNMIATRLDVSADEAEEAKCRVGLNQALDPDVADVVAEAVRPLVSEIRSSVQYYTSSHPGSQIARLALVGGGALLPGLAERLSSFLGVDAYLADPLSRLSDSRRGGRHDQLGRFRSSAAVSIGLTLGAA